MAYSTAHYNPSLAYYQLIGIGEQRRFAIGWTARFGAFYGSDLNYYTAPARLTRDKGGLGASQVVSNIDTVNFERVSMTSLSFGVRAQVKLGPVEIGASADLVGLTVGRWRTGRYQSSNGQFVLRSSQDTDSTLYFRGANMFQQSHPSYLNLRLLGDNDRGTLSTEVYARMLINKRIGIKLAYQWLTSEMTVSNRDVIADNNRFRHRAGMPYLALTFPTF